MFLAKLRFVSFIYRYFSFNYTIGPLLKLKIGSYVKRPKLFIYFNQFSSERILEGRPVQTRVRFFSLLWFRHFRGSFYRETFIPFIFKYNTFFPIFRLGSKGNFYFSCFFFKFVGYSVNIIFFCKFFSFFNYFFCSSFFRIVFFCFKERFNFLCFFSNLWLFSGFFFRSFCLISFFSFFFIFRRLNRNNIVFVDILKRKFISSVKYFKRKRKLVLRKRSKIYLRLNKYNFSCFFFKRKFNLFSFKDRAIKIKRKLKNSSSVYRKFKRDYKLRYLVVYKVRKKFFF